MPVLIFLLLVSGCTKKEVRRELEPGQKRYPIAILPFENLSATFAPIREIREILITKLKDEGFNVLDEVALQKIMERHRIRYVGGIDQSAAQTFSKEAGVEGILITSLEMYIDSVPPKVAMTSRLVSTGDQTTILWMDGVGMAGDDSPGILGLGLIEDTRVLVDNALQSLSDSLSNYVWNDKTPERFGRREKRFNPKVSYRSPEIEEKEKYTIAVIPFINMTNRKYVGEIVPLHFAREMAKLNQFNILELGVVRQRLLNARVILEGGIALTDVDVVANSLEADFVMTGKVFDYQDHEGYGGKPKIDFYVQILERKKRRIVWNSHSYNEGDDGVFFFDWGRINTAHVMMSRMVQMIERKVIEEK